MKSSPRFSVPVLWLILFCPGAAWIGWQDGVANYERFFQDTSIAQRMLSQKTVQHEAVLAKTYPVPLDRYGCLIFEVRWLAKGSRRNCNDPGTRPVTYTPALSK